MSRNKFDLKIIKPLPCGEILIAKRYIGEPTSWHIWIHPVDESHHTDFVLDCTLKNLKGLRELLTEIEYSNCEEVELEELVESIEAGG